MKKCKFIYISLLAITVLGGCDIKENKIDGIKVESDKELVNVEQEDVEEQIRDKELEDVEEQIKMEYTADGIIKPEIAETIIKDITLDVINAIKEKDSETLTTYIHPEKGVRFSPYTYVSTDNDLVFSKKEIIDFFTYNYSFRWGVYDGIGDDINLTPSEYYEKFIYPVDYANAEQTGYNEVLSMGNMITNQFEVFEEPIVVEYYFSGFNPDYGGADWKSLRLVYEEFEGNWVLVGIIHNQWTV